MKSVKMDKKFFVYLGFGLLVMDLMWGLAYGQHILLSAQKKPFMDSLKALYDTTVVDHKTWLSPLISFKGVMGKSVFLGVLIILPLLFLAHFLVIGPKKFSHDKGEILYFGMFARVIHWIVAFSFTVLVLTGLMIVFAQFIGGGATVRLAREWHVVSALVFTFSALPMFLMWLKDMLPVPYDVKWLFMMGGYFSKEKKPVPAGRFNAGQKMWFWLASLGGAVMAWTGWYIYSLSAVTSELRLYVLIHGYLAVVLVGFFFIHLYMSLFAIKGSLSSMITGRKPKEEVEILHSKYKYYT